MGNLDPFKRLKKARRNRMKRGLTPRKPKTGAADRPSLIERIKMKGYKTILVAVIGIVSAFFPGVKEWISQNPEAYASIIGTVMILLRVITKTPVGKSGVGGNISGIMPIFLAVGAAVTLSSCQQLDPARAEISRAFNGLSARIGTDGDGGIAEFTVPPGYGAGVKLYGVTPWTSKLPKVAAPFPIGN